jgi:iron-sulfur cluster assembly protein
MSTDTITWTDVAKAQVEKEIQKRGKGLGIRVGIKTTGCSGLAYVLEYADEEKAGDHVFKINSDLAIYIAEENFKFVKGMKLDYQKHGLNEGFEFINPNEKGRCGCGESFNA